MSAATPSGDHERPAVRAPHTEGRTIRRARFYDLGTTLLSFGRLAALHRTMVKLAGIRSGERILDVGCGPGRLAIAAGTATGPTGEVCGIDPAPEMVELARRKAVLVEEPPLRISDILSVTKVQADGVLAKPSRGAADSEAPM